MSSQNKNRFTIAWMHCADWVRQYWLARCLLVIMHPFHILWLQGLSLFLMIHPLFLNTPWTQRITDYLLGTIAVTSCLMMRSIFIEYRALRTTQEQISRAMRDPKRSK